MKFHEMNTKLQICQHENKFDVTKVLISKKPPTQQRNTYIPDDRTSLGKDVENLS